MKRLNGPQLEYSYAWKTLMKRGVTVAGGSDAPVETCSPLVGLHDAIFRRSRKPSLPASEETKPSQTPSPPGPTYTDPAVAVAAAVEVTGEVFRPEECLTFAEALWIYTVGAAKAAGAETYLGRIEPGFAADFTVLPMDVFNDPAQLKTARPSMVIVGGDIVYHNSKGGGKVEKEVEKEAHTKLPHEGGSDTVAGSVSMGGPYIPGKGGNFMLPTFSHYSSTPSRDGTSSNNICIVGEEAMASTIPQSGETVVDNSNNVICGAVGDERAFRFSCACRFRGIFCRNALR
jgi:hypothetical protein